MLRPSLALAARSASAASRARTVGSSSAASALSTSSASATSATTARLALQSGLRAPPGVPESPALLRRFFSPAASGISRAATAAGETLRRSQARSLHTSAALFQQQQPSNNVWINPDNVPTGDSLKKYSIDLTERAREGKLDPVIGREEEVRRTIQVSTFSGLRCVGPGVVAERVARASPTLTSIATAPFNARN